MEKGDHGRRPKSEIRNPKEGRNPNSKSFCDEGVKRVFGFPFRVSALRVSFGFRPSDFGFGLFISAWDFAACTFPALVHVSAPMPVRRRHPARGARSAATFVAPSWR